MVWLSVALGVAAIVIIALSLKIFIIKYSLKDVNEQAERKLDTDTNLLILLESGDRDVRRFVRRLNRSLARMDELKRQYARGNRELKESVTNISHDLRTPLTSAAGYIGLLKKSRLDDKQREYLAVVEGRMEAMKKLTEELFAYSVIVSDNGTTETEPINLGDALEDSLTQFYTAFTERGIEPQIDIAEKPVVRTLNRDVLSRIFGNIINNAVKYAERDFGVTLKENGSIVFFNTADGLDEVTVGKLFDRFFTVESARGGTGLGLSIARSLTEKMGGTIFARYEEGKLVIELKFIK